MIINLLFNDYQIILSLYRKERKKERRKERKMIIIKIRIKKK